ncbi:MAG: hypothetical protein HKM95_04025 [Inquilinus sp.]|nr:hypothetical protein [Inquilinus sp.]
MSSLRFVLAAGLAAFLIIAGPARAQFAMDATAGDAARAMGMPTVGDMAVGQSGYVASFTPCIERQGLFLPALATVTQEPLSFAQNLLIEIDPSGNILARLYVGDDVPDRAQGLRQLALTIANASSCAAENYYFPNDYSDLLAIVSINGHTGLAPLIQSLQP